MDGLLEYNSIEEFTVEREDGGLRLKDKEVENEQHTTQPPLPPQDNDPLLTTYDKIIRCFGFVFDSSIFKKCVHILKQLRITYTF